MLKRFVVVFTVFALFATLTFAAEVMTPDGAKAPAAPGQNVEGPATLVTGVKDQILLSEGAAVQVQPPDGDVELFLVKRGSVRGVISHKTQVAIPTGWIIVEPGKWARFYAETMGPRRGFVKVDEGQALVVFEAEIGSVYVHLTAGNGIELERTRSGALRFSTHQTNVSSVRAIHRVSDALEIEVIVPKATSGMAKPEQQGKKTRILSDPISYKSGTIALETRFEGEKKHTGSLGPGTFAVIDNSTGVLELAFDEVDFQIVKRATSLTSELSSLAVSNFFGEESPAND